MDVDEEIGLDDVDALTTLGEQLIDAILDEQLEVAKDLVEKGAPVWYQNEAESMSALHAAAYIQNKDLTEYLLQKGAVWNAVDDLNHTAGDVALSFNNQAVYTAIRDAGIRAEMLLSVLSGRPSEASSSHILIRASDDTALASSEVFLKSKLKFVRDGHGQDICLLQTDHEEVGVMMGWETPIMEETVKLLCEGHPQSGQLKILNVGFGLGIIDTLFQVHQPAQHFIIEPHPDVLRHMKHLGWYDRPGVTILEGKWQDCITADQLLGMGGFDVVYIDTFSENYGDLKAFFEHLPDLLAGPDARFSFFNGLGGNNFLFYDVFTRLSELHLSDIGIDVEWHDIFVGDNTSERWGKTLQYFTMPLYRLPVGKMGIS